jgi:hypothetical protein
MAQPVRDPISNFVIKLITNKDFAIEIKELVENVLQGRATVDVLRDRAAIEPAALRAMAQEGENANPYKTTSVTTVTTASMTTLTTVTTVTATYILDAEADDPVE